MSLDNLEKSEISIEEALDRAYTLETDGNLEEALRVCDSILSNAPELAEAHNLRGIILEQTGDKEEALEAYRSALKLDPGFDDAKQNLLDLEEGILETRFQAQRPNPLKVMVWGAIVYGVFLGLAGGGTGLLMYVFRGFSLLLAFFDASLYALSSGIGIFVVGKASRFKNSLLLGSAGALGCGLAWMGTTIVNYIMYLLSPPPTSLYNLPLSIPILLRYVLIGAMTGFGIGLVQKTRRQMIRSIFAGIISFGLYALALPIFYNAMQRLSIDQLIPEGIKFELGVVFAYALAEFIFGCIFGGVIGALFGWVVAHNPVQNLHVVEDRTS